VVSVGEGSAVPARAAGTVALLGLAPAASATTKNFAFADANPVTVGVIQTDLTLLRVTTCQVPAVRPVSLGLALALTNARQMLVRDDGAGALRQYAASSDARSYALAMEAAVEAVLKDRPDAALAALLRAHALAPRDPRPLINASVLLTRDGLPNEALALLGAAAQMPMPPRSPYGISRLAELETDRGYALIALHQWHAASVALTSAYRQAPLLTEAEHNLAAVALCTGHPAQAQQLLTAAARRDRLAAAQVVVNKLQGTSVPVASAVFDLSQGETPVLPQITIPPDAPHGVAAEPEFAALSEHLGSAALANSITVGQLTRRLDTLPLLPVTRQRTNDIIAAIGGAEQTDPSIKKLADARTAALDSDGYAIRTYSAKGCGARKVWVSAQAALDADENRLAISEYRYDTGLAANLANPVAHQLAFTMARNVLEGGIGGDEVAFIAEVGLIADRACAAQQTVAPQQDVNGGLSSPSVPACPPILQGVDFSLNLSVVSFSVNCEEVSIGGSTPGWIGGFATVSHSFVNGSTTIFAGAQVGATIQAGPFGGGAQAQAGGYITVSSDGTINDVGMRGSVSAGGSIGPASAYTGTSLDFSFVGTA